MERTRPMQFLKNVELTLSLESTINNSSIQKSLKGSKYEIKNL